MCALIVTVVCLIILFSVSPTLGWISLLLLVGGLVWSFWNEREKAHLEEIRLSRERSRRLTEEWVERKRLENIRVQGKRKLYEHVESELGGVKERKNTQKKSNSSRKRYKTYNDFLESLEWKVKREAVMERSKGLCEVCDDGVTVAVDVHHVKYPKRWGQEPITDLLAVCRKHHQILHGKVNIQQSGNFRETDITQ